MEELAAHYIEELREFQPQGPYYLGGYCFGGEVAFEMAQQLSAQGQSVAMLAMINAMPPNASFDTIRLSPIWLFRFARNSWYWFRYFCQWTPEQRRTFVSRKTRASRKALGRLLRLGRETRAARDAEDQVDLSLYPEEQRKLWDIHLRASSNYHPRPYAGHITVIRTRFHPFLCSFDPTFGWAEIAHGGVTVKIVPGAHESVLDELYAPDAAAALDECLRVQDGRADLSMKGPGHTVLSMLASSFLPFLEFAAAL
jgi:thioesterase domain-containing protein